MRFSTLLLALIPAIALAAPIPAPAFGFGTRINTKTVQNGSNPTYWIINYRL